MNKSAIQKYAIWARTEMIAQVEQRAYQYGITADGYGEENAMVVQGRALSNQEQEQRWELIQQIKNKGYTQVMEEVAYTWFNRFIALRFMEVNNYLPTHTRVFSDSTGAFKPEILSSAMQVELDGLDRAKIAQLIDANQTEELYSYLLLTQCNALNEALPKMFEKMGGYTEILLPNNILRPDSVLGRMVSDIPEEDWTDQVQIIGWLYQYYNSELKDDTFALLKKNVKITKERIPSATQLFTPDWIVRYMVENSLGRLWIEGHPNDALKSGWKYYLDEAEQEADVQAQLEKIRAEYADLKPQDIKVIDPCMGSGHILVYAFDVLVQIYKSYGISERDAAKLILEKNLYGLDIDDRAAQLAYFAVMMKARQYDRRIFTREIKPHVYAIEESNGINRSQLKYFGADLSPIERNKAKLQITGLLDTMIDAKEYGSILNVENYDWELLKRFAESIDDAGQMSLDTIGIDQTQAQMIALIEIAHVMAQKYHVVTTNPPYMGASGMNAKLSKYVKDNYSDEKMDMFSCCISKCLDMASRTGYVAMITMESWMFLSSFEKLRSKLINQSTVINMVHMPYLGKGGTSLGINFGTVTYVFHKKRIPNYNAYYNYIRYFETDDEGVPLAFPTHNHRESVSKQENYAKIPGYPFVYSANRKLMPILQSEHRLDSIIDITGSQHITANNEKYLRCIWEPAKKSIGESWITYSKGGSFRKWWGNIDLVVDWSTSAQSFYKNNATSNMLKPEYRFREGITWTATTNNTFSARILPGTGLFDKKGPALFPYKNTNYVLGLLNSSSVYYILKMFKEGADYQNIEIKRLPLVAMENEYIDEVSALVEENIALVRADWDSYETSLDFKKNPLIALAPKIEDAIEKWTDICQERFITVKKNEERINQIFMEHYGLDEELTSDVNESEVSITRPEPIELVKDLISYAVGCMFGRYSLDKDGCVSAGEELGFEDYCTFIPDNDNCIPITDEEYFEDDIVGLFCTWVKKAFGCEFWEENLGYIASVLGTKGSTSREIIRNYFVNEYFKDHCGKYSVVNFGRRPIYWLFDSGKQNGFKALIYMHRYQSDLLARMRTDYVHEMQERYRTQLTHLNDSIAHASTSERVKLNKQLKKIQDQALELQKYEEKIHHLADRNISIDLDDGVKHNYALFGDVLAKIK